MIARAVPARLGRAPATCGPPGHRRPPHTGTAMDYLLLTLSMIGIAAIAYWLSRAVNELFDSITHHEEDE